MTPVLVREAGLPTDAGFAVALGPVLLRLGLPGADDILRVSIPPPTAAFTRRDTHRPGFRAAVAAVRDLGFEPVVRPHGGLLAAYHAGSIVLDHVVRTPSPHADVAARFSSFANLQARALSALGADVRIGMLPGEYCPGEFSLNLGGRSKLAGSAQRVTRDGWLFSTVFQVSDPDSVREVLGRAYAHLGYDYDPDRVGCLADSGLHVTPAEVGASLVGAYEVTSTVEVPANQVSTALEERSRWSVT